MRSGSNFSSVSKYIPLFHLKFHPFWSKITKLHSSITSSCKWNRRINSIFQIDERNSIGISANDIIQSWSNCESKKFKSYSKWGTTKKNWQVPIVERSFRWICKHNQGKIFWIVKGQFWVKSSIFIPNGNFGWKKAIF